MAKSQEKIKTIIMKIPRDKARLMHERILPFLDLYNDEQRIQTRYYENHPRNEFDLLSLCYSCYSQGLRDAAEALENQKK